MNSSAASLIQANSSSSRTMPIRPIWLPLRCQAIKAAPRLTGSPASSRRLTSYSPTASSGPMIRKPHDHRQDQVDQAGPPQAEA